MYAVRKHYVRQVDFQKPEERYTVKIEYGGKPVQEIKTGALRSVDEEVMYWRKANQIHGWFVNNVQRGNDDCGEYYVSDDRLRQLLDVCRRVIEASKLVPGTVYAGTVYDKEHPEGVIQRVPGKMIEDATVAKGLLPRVSGFFFGNQEYDEEYLKDVVDTQVWAERMLADCKAGVAADVYYHSSW